MNSVALLLFICLFTGYDGMVFHGVAVGTHVIEVRMLNTLCSALPPLKVSFTMAKKVLSYSM